MTSTFSIAANGPAFDLLSRVSETDRPAWEQRLCACRPSPVQKWSRLIAARFLRSQQGNSRHLLTAIKRIRAKIKPDPFGRNETLPSPPWRTNADLVLTHDLDWNACWESLDTILAWEREVGARCTIEVLTKGPYRLDRGQLDEWASQGVEIGLHGEWHDPALAYRSAEEIEGSLRRAIDALGRKPLFFRSPAISLSPTLYEVLGRVGIPADGSRPVFSGIYSGCGFPSVYRYPDAPVLEFPLAVQDDLLFRDRRLTDEEALGLVLDMLQRFREAGGTMVINTHPGVIIKHERFYRGLLETCCEQSIRYLPIGEVSEISQN